MLPTELIKTFDQLLGDGRDEVEVRFGHFRANQFESNLIDRSHYLNVLEHLDGMVRKHPGVLRIPQESFLPNGEKRTQARIVHYDQFGIRKVMTPGASDQYQEKSVQFVFDVEDWGLRFVRSREVDLEEREIIPVLIRTHNRITYIDTRESSFFYGFKIDLSQVVTEEINRPMDGRIFGSPKRAPKVTYELELELNNSNWIPDLNRWYSAITTLYGWTLNAEYKDQIISQTEQLACRKALASTFKRSVDKLVNRPKTLPSLNQITDQAVTIKTDGVNKMLLITPHGTYLYSPNLEVTKVGHTRSDGVTVIEGEYIKEEKTFYAYDIMSLDGNLLINSSFMDRYTILQIVAKDMATWKLRIKILVKTFLFGDERGMIREYLKSQKNDGLIFQSLGPYYNEDTFKWKPVRQLTIDFYVKDSIGYVIDKNRLTPFGIGRIEVPNELRNSPVNIFECRFVKGVGWMAVRPRPDKAHPNSLLVARSNYNSVRFPITEGDLFAHLD